MTEAKTGVSKLTSGLRPQGIVLGHYAITAEYFWTFKSVHLGSHFSIYPCCVGLSSHGTHDAPAHWMSAKSTIRSWVV